jgi:hypothetical protein
MTTCSRCDFAVMQGVQVVILDNKKPYWIPRISWTKNVSDPDQNLNIIKREFQLPSMTIRLYIWMMPWSSHLFLEQIGQWHNEAINYCNNMVN